MFSSSSSTATSDYSNPIPMGIMRPLVMERGAGKWKYGAAEIAPSCPRCASANTKFCYYNNYSLSQPRYFCKTCRRYWTKGGTLRNIPVGGGCRKNKKVSSKKSSSNSADNQPNVGMSPQMSYAHPHGATDLHLAFPDQLHFHASAALYGTTAPSYMLDNPTPIDFMDNKYEALLGGGGGHDAFMDGYGGGMAPSAGMFSPLGFDHGNHQTVLESCQRLMLPYDNHHQNDVAETKPNAKILSLEWHDHQQQQQQQPPCNSDAGKDSFGYSFGSWTGLMNAYGSSATNPLV